MGRIAKRGFCSVAIIAGFSNETKEKASAIFREEARLSVAVS